MSKSLLKPYTSGSLNLQHRVMMAAMTRLRQDPATEAPRDLTIKFYEQRSSPGGLLLTECCAVDPSARGYIRGGALYNDAHLAGWKKVTQAVHGKQAKIFCQLFHPGRITHSTLIGGGAPVAPSAVQPAGQVHTASGKVDYEMPRALDIAEIPSIIDMFVKASRRAIDAGFDGVELHAGNGYLLQQFLAQKTNQRTDKYGGSVENRARLLLEVIDACAAEIGAERVSVKLQPGVTFSDLIEPEEDVGTQLDFLAPKLAAKKLAFVELSSVNGPPYCNFVGLSVSNINFDPFTRFRGAGYDGTLAINGALTPEAAEKYVSDGVADLASFAVAFMANANLPELIAAGAELNMGGGNPAVWYSMDPAEDEKAYTDWPLVTPN